MGNVIKLLVNSTLFLGILAFATSCTDVYFEKPVPQAGTALQVIPASWSGVYVTEPDKPGESSELEQIFRQCYRFERMSDNKLLVSTELRIQAIDIPKLKRLLEDQKKDSTLVDFQLTDSYIFCVLKVEDKNRPGAVEQQYSSLIKKDNWYILGQTMVPFRLYNLEKGTQTEYEVKHHKALKVDWLPEADSIETEEIRLVARQKDQAYYFNTQADGESKWSLLYVTQPSKGHLIVKVSNLEDTKDFERRYDYFNAITPFQKTDSTRYLINPTDAALDRLMQEEHLFKTTKLRKIE